MSGLSGGGGQVSSEKPGMHCLQVTEQATITDPHSTGMEHVRVVSISG